MGWHELGDEATALGDLDRLTGFDEVEVPAGVLPELTYTDAGHGESVAPAVLHRPGWSAPPDLAFVDDLDRIDPVARAGKVDDGPSGLFGGCRDKHHTLEDLPAVDRLRGIARSRGRG